MAYQGWNRDELVAAGSRTGGTHYINAPSSFTPINTKRTHLPCLQPDVPLGPLERHLEGDSTYRVHDEPSIDTTTKSSKQRKPAQKVRMNSLGAMWENEDGQDTYNNGAAFEQPPPKRKKATISKRSQSLKIPQTSNENRSGGEADVPSAFQLTTPPDSHRREKSKVGPALKAKAKQTPPFKNPTITKPLTARAKENFSEIHRRGSIISHNAWRSTEDNMKFKPIIIARTTMDKLAAYRCQPCPGPPTTPITQLPLLRSAAQPVVKSRLAAPLALVASDYDPSSESLLDDAVFGIEAPVSMNNSSHIEPQPTQHVDTRMAEYLQSPCTEAAVVSPYAALNFVRLKKCGSSTLQRPLLSTSSQCFGDITSSEARAFDDLSITGQLTLGRSAQNEDDFSRSTPIDKNDGPLLTSTDAEDIGMEGADNAKGLKLMIDDTLLTYPLKAPGNFHVDMASLLDPSETFEDIRTEALHCTSVAPCSSDNSHALPRHQEHLHSHKHVGRSDTIIQAERAEIDKSEVINTHWDSDEYGEGLDDSELVVMSENAMPETPHNTSKEQPKTSKTCRRFRLSSMPNNRLHAPAQQYLPIQAADKTGLLHSRNIAESDDEFPMDGEDEEELLKLPENGSLPRASLIPSQSVQHEDKDLPKLSDAGSSVKGSLAPPESVQRDFYLREDGEVYDKSFQFSPVKSLDNDNPTKTTRGERMNTCRATPSPGVLKDLSSPEAIDWSYVRSQKEKSNTLCDISDPFVDPITSLDSEVLVSHQASSVPNKHSAAASGNGNKAGATRATSVTSWRMIDDSYDYGPMKPFARPEFPALILDRCPVVGLSAQMYLRTCFRIGELFKERVKCASLLQDAVIELFARVTFSSREDGSTKQTFQFADLWSEHAPFPTGILANYKSTGLAESESRVFLSERGKIARCLGRFKRDAKNNVWLLHIINIRETDWEEIRWTKEVVSYGEVKSEKG